MYVRLPSTFAAGTELERLYTPVAVTARTIAILVKRFAGSALTHCLFNAVPGETTLAVSWPHGRFVYTPNTAQCMLVVTAGSGITVGFRALEAVLADPMDRTRIVLVYQSRSRPEILLQKELRALLAAHPDRFVAHFLVRHSGRAASQPHANVRYSSGDVNEDALATALELGHVYTPRPHGRLGPGSGGQRPEGGIDPSAAETAACTPQAPAPASAPLPQGPPDGPAYPAPHAPPAADGDAVDKTGRAADESRRHASDTGRASGSLDPSPATATESYALDPRPHVWLVGPPSFIVHTERCLDALGVEVVHCRRVFADSLPSPSHLPCTSGFTGVGTAATGTL